jgi:RHS repeat-associated protein
VAELDGSNNVLSTFVYGLKPSVPDYMVRGGVAYRIVSDWRGDVRLVVNSATAAVVQQLDYDEWGNVINLVDPSCTVGGTALCWQPFGFAGGVWDVTTGAVRLGARDYDPALRRWTQKDPIRFDGGINVYEYAAGDPINGSDPSGLDPTNEQCLAMAGAGQAACQGNCNSVLHALGALFGGESKQTCLDACTKEANYQIDQCDLTLPPNGPPFPPQGPPPPSGTGCYTGTCMACQ